jgi:hypothetical protein
VGELEALIAQQMPDLNTVVPSLVAGMGSVDLARTLIAKLLAIFGLSEVLPAFWEVLEQGWGNILKELGEAIQARDWRRVRRLLKKLLDIIISQEFFNRLKQRVGAKLAAKIVGKILAHFIPVVGWVLLIGAIIWAIAEEFI